MTITIRIATADDAEALATLKRETFRQSFVTGGFRIPYPPDDLATFEAATYSPDAIRADLADSKKTNWIAFRGDRMIGFAQAGSCKLPHPEVTADAGELHQLYVREGEQGLGVGGRLLESALDYLALAYPGPQWLGVWSGNHRAQAIYAKMGFERVGCYEFPVGAWRDQEYVFRRATS